MCILEMHILYVYFKFIFYIKYFVFLSFYICMKIVYIFEIVLQLEDCIYLLVDRYSWIDIDRYK